jgi:hypothetical protein
MKDLICILGVLFVVGAHESLTEIILNEVATNEQRIVVDSRDRGPVPEFTFIQEKVGR